MCSGHLTTRALRLQKLGAWVYRIAALPPGATVPRAAAPALDCGYRRARPGPMERRVTALASLARPQGRPEAPRPGQAPLGPSRTQLGRRLEARMANLKMERPRTEPLGPARAACQLPTAHKSLLEL